MAGFWCHLQGYWTQEPAFWEGLSDNLREPLFNGIWIKRNKIPSYQTDDYQAAYETWYQWHDHHLLPTAGGWAEQPAIVSEIFAIFEFVYGKFKETK